MSQKNYSLKNILSIQKKKFTFLIFSIIGIFTLPLPMIFPSPGLDLSVWIGLNMTRLKNLQFGHDVISSFGPLGFLYSTTFVDPSNWVLALIYRLFVHSFFIFSIGFFFTKLSVSWKNYLLIVLMLPTLALVEWIEQANDEEMLLSFIVFFYLIITNRINRKYEIPLVSFAAILLAIQSLIKFDMAIANLSVIVIFSAISLSMKEFRRAAVAFASYFILILLLWSSTGQDFANLPGYISTSLDFSKGYNYSMAVNGPSWQVLEGLLSVIFVIILLAYSLKKKVKNLLIFIFLSMGLLFESFKHGFIRQDEHVLFFFFTFGLFFISAYSIYKYDTSSIVRNNYKRVLLLCLLFLSILCVASIDVIRPDIMYWITKTIPPWITAIPMIFDQLHQDQMIEDGKSAGREYYHLDNGTVQYIENKTMDIIPWDIALPWDYNFNWSPRPQWDSFATFTPEVDQSNAQYFAGKKAPQIILYGYKSIDGRYPLFDEPQTFATILHNYQFINKSGEFVLLSNNPKEKINETEQKLYNQSFELGEPIGIPKFKSGYVFVNVNLNLSPLGKFMNIVYKPALAHIRFKFSDSTYSDEFRLQRISNNDFFLSQYVSNVYDLSSIFSGKITNDINEMIISVDDPAQYEDRIQVEFVEIPANVSIQESKVENWNLLKVIKGGMMYIDFVGNNQYSQTSKVIDIDSHKDKFIRISGWAFDDIAKDGTVKTFLVFRSSDQNIILSTQKEIRSDLSKVFGVDSYQYGGWKTSIDTSKFVGKCYALSLRIPRSNGLEFFELDGNKTICFH